MTHIENTIFYLLLFFPLTVWGVSYLFLVLEFRTWNLLRIKIHESGRYTLPETVFYFNHFLRELPIDTLYALSIYFSYSSLKIADDISLKLPTLFTTSMLVSFLLITILGSIHSVGIKYTLMDVFQFREQDYLIHWGAHWQMHFLSTLAVILLLIAPGLMSSKTNLTDPYLVAIFCAILALSLIFRTGMQALKHTRWMLHGAREVFTYFFISFAPAMGPIYFFKSSIVFEARTAAVICFVLFGIINLYFIYIYSKSSLEDEAQSNRGILYLLSSHFFEHVLDATYIFLLVVFLLKAKMK